MFDFTSLRAGRRIFGLTALAAVLVVPAIGQDGGYAGGAGDPPSRVARIAYRRGDVSLEPAGVEQFADAELNYPLTAGDRVYVANDGLSELQTAGLAVRLANGADLTLTSLTDNLAQLGLAQGSVRVRTRTLQTTDGQAANVEIDTPNGTIVVEQPGDVRVDSYPQDDTTVVTVNSGAVDVSGPGFEQTLGAGRSIRLAGTNPVYAEAVALLPADALDSFDAGREHERERAEAREQEYVSPEMVGAAELDDYGDWTPQPEYGAVWYPRAVAADWAPYRNGHWAWVAPWGWTWVEAEPWGFAPFHYGRWAQFGGRWGWVPGPPPSIFGGAPPRPVYSPALVAFVGGPQFSISIGFGGGSGAGVTAWFPLGPRETYVPWYHASPRYVNRVNVTNIYNNNVTEIRNVYNNRTTNIYNTNITNVTYVNRTVATTAVPQRAFAGGAANVQTQQIRLDESARRQLAMAPVLPHPLVTPARTLAAPQAAARAIPPNQGRPTFVAHGGPGAGAPGVLAAGGGASPARPGMRIGSYTPPAQGSVQPGVPQRANVPVPSQGTAAGGVRPSFPLQRDHPVAGAGEVQPGGMSGAQQAGGRPGSAAPGAPLGANAGGGAGRAPEAGGAPRSEVETGREPVMQPVRPAGQPVRPPSPAVHPAPPAVAGSPVGQPVPEGRGPARSPEVPRPLLVKTPPQAVAPPFARQQQAIERNDPGRPLGPGQMENLRNGRPAGAPQQAEPIGHPAPRTLPPPVRGAVPTDNRPGHER